MADIIESNRWHNWHGPDPADLHRVRAVGRKDAVEAPWLPVVSSQTRSEVLAA